MTQRFDQLTRPSLREYAKSAVVVIPLGSTEQHGPHLPTGTDSAIIGALADRAVAAVGERAPVVLTPVLPFGIAGHHVPLGATMSLTTTAYLDVLTELGTSLHGSGFSRLLFLNGHGGNDPVVQTVGSRLVSERQLPIHVAATSYWTIAADVLDRYREIFGPVPGHAGNFETSCMLAIAPDQVHLGLAPDAEPDLQPLAHAGIPGAVVNRPGVWEASDGRTDDSARADADLGRRVLDEVGAVIADFIVRFHASTVPGPVLSGSMADLDHLSLR